METKILEVSRKSDGVVIQLPLPKRLQKHRQRILNNVPPNKDIDALSDHHLVESPVVLATKYILKDNNVNLIGKSVVVMGAGKLVGIPMILWLLRENASVSTVHKYTKNGNYYVKKADIIISGVGKPNLVTGRMVKNGVIVIDLGFCIINGKICGDVNFKTVSKKAKMITPVPGGIGGLTIACLLENLWKLEQL